MIYTDSAIDASWRDITLALIDKGLTISTMESCTAGLVASLITDTEGASAVMKGAFVTYCNEAKVMQGVPAGIIENFGVYSGETAAAMARACRSAYGADIGIGVTGTLGRVDPANADSVSGEVFFAVEHPGGTVTRSLKLPPVDSRRAAKRQTAGHIAEAVMSLLGSWDADESRK